MSDQGNETKRLAYAVLAFLDEEFRKPSTTTDSRESLEVAMQCLETAFGITLRDTCLKPSKSLREIYQNPSTSTSGMPNGSFTLPPAFANLMSGAGQVPPAPAPTRNIQALEIDLGAHYSPPSEASREDKNLADFSKDAGNACMKDGDFNEALKLYTEAIDLDGNNAVYFCNRSAAYIKLDDLEKALRDVQVALQLDPTYARAYGRMGVIQSTLGNHLKAYSCYKKANELDPGNDSYENNLRVSAEIINNQSQGQGDAIPNPLGGANQFASLFQNPALMTMATQMLQDPGMQNMMRSFMTNLQPNLQANGAGGGAGVPAGFEQILQMGQAIAAQISESYSPDAAGRRQGDPNDQDPPPNDSYDL